MIVALTLVTFGPLYWQLYERTRWVLSDRYRMICASLIANQATAANASQPNKAHVPLSPKSHKHEQWPLELASLKGPIKVIV